MWMVADARQQDDSALDALVLDIAARIRSGAYLNYYSGPYNLAVDAVDAYLAARSPSTSPEDVR